MVRRAGRAGLAHRSPAGAGVHQSGVYGAGVGGVYVKVDWDGASGARGPLCDGGRDRLVRCSGGATRSLLRRGCVHVVGWSWENGMGTVGGKAHLGSALGATRSVGKDGSARRVRQRPVMRLYVWAKLVVSNIAIGGGTKIKWISIQILHAVSGKLFETVLTILSYAEVRFPSK